MWVLEAAGGLAGAVWTAAAAPPGRGGRPAGRALLVMPLPWRLRCARAAAAAAAAGCRRAAAGAGQFEVVVADVGQGTAVLVRTRDHLLVYDAGRRYSAEADAGAARAAAAAARPRRAPRSTCWC
jgi:competence protein ComEC